MTKQEAFERFLENFVKALEVGMKENTYPRKTSEAAMAGVYPRPACVHDPAGMLEECDVCGDRKGRCR